MRIKHGKTFTEFFCTPRFFITWLCLSAIACIIFAFVVFGSLVNKKILPSNNVPKTIPYITIPSQYNVFLNFNATPTAPMKAFTGSLEMEFVARDETQRLFLHRGQNIKISKITLDDSTGMSSTPDLGAYDSSSEVQAYIPISNLTKDGNYSLHLEFEGTIASEPDGLSVLSYASSSGGTRNAILLGRPVTEITGLRYLMPCLDSQDFPALFNFNIQHSSSFRAISNFPAHTQQTTQFTFTIFNATFEMTTAEVAIALIDVELTPEIVQSDGLTLNKYFRKNVINTISNDRIKQFMAPKTTTIGKIDVLSLPGLTTMQQPGISFLNEHDVARENIDLGLVGT